MDDKTKEVNAQHVEHPTVTEMPDNAAVKAVFSVGLTDSLVKDKHNPWSRSMFKLYGIMALVTLNDCMNGYDGSLMGAINAMQPYHDFFHVGMEGSGTGIIFCIYYVGNLVGSLFAGTVIDLLGRRSGMFGGSVFIIIGTIIEATAPSIGAFIGGRFLIGFGVALAVTAAPVYLVEMAYPSWRGITGGLYNVVGYYVGAIIATWTTYGTGHMTTNWAWRLPVILQAVPSVIIVAFVWLLPESPRWLVSHGKTAVARDVLVKYHGNGDPNSAVAALELSQIQASLDCETELSDKRWWDYRPLFNSRPALYRIWLIMLVTVFSQFIGGSVISYYMPVILENIGITGTNQQLLLNALNTVFSFLGGIAGSFTVDKFGRRNLFLWGTFLTMLCYIPINVIAAEADSHVATGPGYAFVAFIFLYGIIFSFCWTPLQALYPAEVLNNEIRAKGMAFQGFVSGLAGFINTYATPVALKNIGYWTYTIFLIFHFLEWVAMYFTVVETKQRSLEELEEIFRDPKPVKKSLQKHEVLIADGGVQKVIEEG